MAAPIVTPLPEPVPSRTSPSTFSVDMDAFLGALPTFADEVEAAGLFAQTEALAAEAQTGWNFSTTTAMADPGSGNIRFNNATLSSVSLIAIDDLNGDGQDYSGYVLTWDDSNDTIKGNLVIRQRAGAYAVFNITGLTDNSGWTQLAVNYVTGGGTFLDATSAGISFTRTGATSATFNLVGTVLTITSA